MLAKVVLWFTAVSYLIYGVLCLVNPQMPTGYAGLTISSGDALLEVAAMYGGMQTGIGLFCLIGALKPIYTKPTLLFIALALGGLAAGRTLMFLITDQPVTSYTYGAIGFEWVLCALAVAAVAKHKPA